MTETAAHVSTPENPFDEFTYRELRKMKFRLLAHRAVVALVDDAEVLRFGVPSDVRPLSELSCRVRMYEDALRRATSKEIMRIGTLLILGPSLPLDDPRMKAYIEAGGSDQ